jgi:small subunit ribosomal protein S4
MVRFTGPKNKIARKFGANLFGRLRNPLIHKPNPPGVHGAKRKKKSDYGLQLEEKQKLRAIFGMISQKQLLKYFKEATRRPGKTADLFLLELETRLDIVVYRLKFASTIFAAQQLVSHGHILVNGKRVDRRSFKVKPGMTISIREKSQKNALIAQSIESSREVPEYLTLDAAKFSGEFVLIPEADQIPIPEINVPLVCEFLAHSS